MLSPDLCLPLWLLFPAGEATCSRSTGTVKYCVTVVRNSITRTIPILVLPGDCPLASLLAVVEAAVVTGTVVVPVWAVDAPSLSSLGLRSFSSITLAGDLSSTLGRPGEEKGLLVVLT